MARAFVTCQSAPAGCKQKRTQKGTEICPFALKNSLGLKYVKNGRFCKVLIINLLTILEISWHRKCRLT
ncbi:hypothetical protein HMPREF1146_2619 [Prevotella sp. MSX73]|nr:hypothetical protein HMPREF1146_2619 [Prevotella sp. MSX73]